MKRNAFPVGQSACAAQRGTSLIFALVALAGLSVAGAAMMRSSDTASLVAGSIGFQESATKATERAIEAGIAGVMAMSASARQSNDADRNYFATLESVNLEPTPARLSPTTDQEIIDTQTGNTVRYVVERMCQSGTAAPAAATCVMDGTMPLFRVTALAIGPRYSSETTQALFTISVPVPACGIMTQANVKVQGQTTQLGSSNCYHSNGNLNISGTMQTAGLEAKAVGTATYSGGGPFTVDLDSGESSRELPAVDPTIHKPFATHLFTATGECSATVQGSSDGARNCTGWPNGAWKWLNPTKRWVLDMDFDATLPPTGLYYFEANVEIPKKMGRLSPYNPAVISIVSEMSVLISGEVHLSDYTNLTHPSVTNQVFILAKGDLELPGSSTYRDATATSSMLAGAELKVNGAITIDANLVARNESLPVGAQNWVTENDVSGNIIQTYNGTGGSLTPTASRQRWRLVTR
jgi:type IV pilus assembly protein PilX